MKNSESEELLNESSISDIKEGVQSSIPLETRRYNVAKNMQIPKGGNMFQHNRSADNFTVPKAKEGDEEREQLTKLNKIKIKQ